MSCEGVGQTIVKGQEEKGLQYFCTAVDPKSRVYTASPPECPADIRMNCKARRLITGSHIDSEYALQRGKSRAHVVDAPEQVITTTKRRGRIDRK